MTNEEIQRTMEFIVEHQAQFAANIQQLEEERRRDAPRIARLEESYQILVQLAQTTDARLDFVETKTWSHEENHSRLDATMNSLAESQSRLDVAMISLGENHSRLDAAMASLGENHSRLDAAMISLAEAQSNLAASQAHADARLSALIDIVGGQSNGES